MAIAKKIASICLALLVLVATVGITVNKHYCMGQVRYMAINLKADSCMEAMGLESAAGCFMGCCHDTSQQFKAEVEKITTPATAVTPPTQLVAVVAWLVVQLDLPTALTHQTHFLNYKPPLIDQYLPVLVQSFLL